MRKREKNEKLTMDGQKTRKKYVKEIRLNLKKERAKSLTSQATFLFPAQSIDKVVAQQCNHNG